VRAVTARIGLTANTPREAVYLMAKLDDDLHPLSGAGRYTLTFDRPPPFIAPGFWSLTMYDGRNNYTVPNPIHRYSLGSDDSLRSDADGSVTIYLQRESPGPDREANWLPTSDGPFYLVLRAYAPGRAMIETLERPGAYRPPVVKSVE
jgi:DNA sulfur modification protein DndE